MREWNPEHPSIQEDAIDHSDRADPPQGAMAECLPYKNRNVGYTLATQNCMLLISLLNIIIFGTSAHIPGVSLFCNPWTVAMFHTIPEQGKNWTPKQSIPEQHGLFFC